MLNILKQNIFEIPNIYTYVMWKFVLKTLLLCINFYYRHVKTVMIRYSFIDEETEKGYTRCALFNSWYLYPFGNICLAAIILVNKLLQFYCQIFFYNFNLLFNSFTIFKCIVLILIFHLNSFWHWICESWPTEIRTTKLVRSHKKQIPPAPPPTTG